MQCCLTSSPVAKGVGEVSQPVEHLLRLQPVADAVVVVVPHRAVVLQRQAKRTQVVIGGTLVETFLCVVEDGDFRRVFSEQRSISGGREVLPDERVTVERQRAVLLPRQLVDELSRQHWHQVDVRVVRQLVEAAQLDGAHPLQQEAAGAPHVSYEVEPRHRVDAEQNNAELFCRLVLLGEGVERVFAMNLNLFFLDDERVEVCVHHIAGFSVARYAYEFRRDGDIFGEGLQVSRVFVQVVRTGVRLVDRLILAVVKFVRVVQANRRVVKAQHLAVRVRHRRRGAARDRQ